MKRFVLVLTLLATACGADPDPTLRAGAATRLLRIPVGHSHAGYLQSRRLGAPFPGDDPGSPFADLFPATRSLQSAPRAKALVVERGSQRLVLVQLDVVFVTATLRSRIEALAEEKLGLKLGQSLLVHATHTHASAGRFSDRSFRPRVLAGEPEGQRHALAHGADTFSPESLERIALPAVEAIGEAMGSLREARIGWARGENDTANRDRRCHDDWLTGKGDVDPTVTVLRVDSREGEPIAVLFHYAMHGTLYDHDSRALSVDAPGHAEYAVERAFDSPVVAIYLQGAAASASPAGDLRGHTGSQAMQRVGHVLARTVIELWSSIDPRADVPLQFKRRSVELSRAGLGYASGEFEEDGAMLCFFLDAGCKEQSVDPEKLDCFGRALPRGGKYHTEVATLRIGDLAILALPGEPSTELGRRLRTAALDAGYAHAIALGYSQDHDGYLLLDEDWLSGGSETNITFWGWKLAGHLAAQVGSLLLSTDFAPLQEQQEPAAIRFDPVVAVPSTEPPALLEQPPASVERLDEVRVAFLGEDPALGTPEVRLQVERGEGFEDVLHAGWIPASNLHGPELPTFYEADPSHAEEPEAKTRLHRWEVSYEVPPELPEGRYRFAIPSLELHSEPFEVRASTRLEIDGRLEGSTLFLTLRYPPNPPIFSDSPRNEGWQLGNFRMLDPDFGPPFLPVREAQAVAEALVDGSPVPLRWQGSPPERLGKAYRPGEGWGFSVELPSGASVLRLEPGALRDRFGNGSRAFEFALQ